MEAQWSKRWTVPVIKLLFSSKFSLFACSLKMELSGLDIFLLLTREGNRCSTLSLENSRETAGRKFLLPGSKALA